MTNRPQKKEHHLTCESDIGKMCNCGARQWNLCCDRWEEYLPDEVEIYQMIPAEWNSSVGFSKTDLAKAISKRIGR